MLFYLLGILVNELLLLSLLSCFPAFVVELQAPIPWQILYFSEFSPEHDGQVSQSVINKA